MPDWTGEAARLLMSAIRRRPDCSAMVYYLAGQKPFRLSVGRRFPHRPSEATALEKALEDAGMADRYTPEQIRGELVTQGVYPEDIVKQMTENKERNNDDSIE